MIWNCLDVRDKYDVQVHLPLPDFQPLICVGCRSSTKPVPLPSRQEVHRKLSIHAKPIRVSHAMRLAARHPDDPLKSSASPRTLSGTESNLDLQMQVSDVGSSLTVSWGGPLIFVCGLQQPLQSIAECRSRSCDELDEDEDKPLI